MDILISDVELLDLLRRVVEEKELALEEAQYRRLLTALAEALCLEFGCSLLWVATCDEPGATVYLQIDPDSVLAEYGDLA